MTDTSIIDIINTLSKKDKNKLKTVIHLILSYEFKIKDIKILIDSLDSTIINTSHINITDDMLLNDIYDIREKYSKIDHILKLVKNILSPELTDILKKYLIYRIEKKENSKKENSEKKSPSLANNQYLLYLGQLIRMSD